MNRVSFGTLRFRGAEFLYFILVVWQGVACEADDAVPRHKPALRQTSGGEQSAKNAKAPAGKVSGIWISRGDAWITVKADGEMEPVKYTFDPADKDLKETFKHVFHAARVHLTYQPSGDARQLLSIKRHVIKPIGTITGEVVQVHENFWVEVKPKVGLADAFAPGANYNDKAFMETLRGLRPQDTVTIKYNTDFERHRILSLRVHPGKPPKLPAKETK